MSTAAAITLQECVAHLAAVAGHEHAHVAGETVVVAPRDAMQIAEILRLANANGIAVEPTGGGTKLGWGNPVDAGIRLDLKRMKTLREHAWQDMTCTVEAGCTWAAMQAELARHGQMVALDPLLPERATVGGVVATNDSGALRLRYGGLRDLIIGMTIVLADATIAKTGGKVVKNVAGYDLHKLMTGNSGTLGVIAEVNFRLHPVEVHARTWTAVAAEAIQFDAALRALLDSQMTPSSAQLRVRGQECALDVRIAAPAECMDEQEARLKKIFGEIELRESDESELSKPGSSKPEWNKSVWQARQELFELQGAVILKASMLPGDLCGVSAELQRRADESGVEIAIAAQATGLMTIAIGSVGEPAITLVDYLRSKLKTTAGSVVVLQIPQELRDRIDVWGPESNSVPLMREIKRRFDPNRILNPGRFVGGI